MSEVFKWIKLALAAAVLAVIVFVFWANSRYVVPILTYHHVSDALPAHDLNNVSPAVFAAQMAFLKKYHYRVISFEEFVQGVKNKTSFARNTVVIHFDDGVDDNYTQAFPVLKQHGFPAMVFLISDVIGTPGFVTWDQMKEMEAGGFKAGAHTRQHPYLPEIPLVRAKEEIFGSKRVIEERLGHPIHYFVYPAGGFTDEIKALVQEAGYQAAATTNRGRDVLNQDLFELNRIRVKGTDLGFKFWAKASGFYNLFRKSRYSPHMDKDYDLKI